MKMTSKYVRLKTVNMRLHYRGFGDPKNPTILFLHGLRGSSKTAARFAKHLKGYQVILLDLPGYGKSDSLPLEHTLHNLAATVSDFIETIQLTKVTVIGHSFGGTLAYVIGALFPKNIAQIVLITPALTPGGVFLRIAKLYYDIYVRLPLRMQQFLLTNYQLIWIASDLMLTTGDQKIKQRYLKDAHDNSRTIDPRTIAEIARDMNKINLEELAHSIKVPIFILGAELDTLTPATYLEKLSLKIPNADFQVLSQIGHLSPVEIPQKLASVIIEYLEIRRSTH